MDRVAIYGRVSTSEQTTDNQINFLQEIVSRNGWELVQTYVDEGISGTKGRDKRPEFDRLCKDMVRRKFNRILVWDISRLGRSLQHLVEFLNEVQSVNCHLYIHQSGLDTSTPSGRMMFQMVGVFSEFERSMISERVKLSLLRAKKEGRKLGRPKKISDATETLILEDFKTGSTKSAIALKHKISRMSVSRICKKSKFSR
ncbi:recombinase family protein [Planktomarina temperata]|nr:recombinase family protein [Planktomarina temperata]